MEKIMVKTDSLPCYIHFYYNTFRSFESLFSDIEKLKEFEKENLIIHILSIQKSYKVHLEKTEGRYEREENIIINFDSTRNEELIKYTKGKTLSFEGVIKQNRIEIFKVKLLPKEIGKSNNRKITANFHFFLNETSFSPISWEVRERLNKLPFAREQSQLVKKRLESWEIYLDLQKENAKNNELEIHYTNARSTNNLQSVKFICPHLAESDYKNKNLREAQVKIMKTEEKIGKLRRVILKDHTVEVELDEDYVELLRENKWAFPSDGSIHVSNYGDLAQASRLRNGFNKLRNGEAENLNIENLLFENNPVSDDGTIANNEIVTTMEKQLNRYQYEAVKGALDARDLYLIQGPPGTGKTTVIGEICYQNAVRGLKTLVASQSNLAVDNALNKLLNNSKVRILRKGRTTSIEEEGKKYIEENVAETWKEQVESKITTDVSGLAYEINHLETSIKNEKAQLVDNKEILKNMSNAAEIKKDVQYNENKLKDLRAEIKKNDNSIVLNVENMKGLKFKIENNNKEKSELRNLLEYWEESNPWKIKKDNLNHKLITLRNDLEYLKKLNEFKMHKKDLQVANEKYLQLKKLDEEGLDNYEKVDQLINKTQFIIPENLERKRCQINDTLSFYATEESNKKLYELNKLLTKIESLVAAQENILTKYDNNLLLTKEFSEITLFQKDLLTSLSIEIFSDQITEKGKRMLTFMEPGFLEKSFAFITSKQPKTIIDLKNDYIENVGIWKLIRNEKEKTEEIIETHEKTREEIPNLQSYFLAEINKYFKEKIDKVNREILSNKNKTYELEKQLNQLELYLSQDINSLNDIESRNTVEEVAKQIQEVNSQLASLGSEESYKKELKNKIEDIERKSKWFADQYDNDKENLEMLRSTLKELKHSEDELSKIILENKENLKSIIGIDEVTERTRILYENPILEKRLRKNKEDIVTLTNKIELKKQWLIMLTEAKEHDMREIRNLYIHHANVIGTTCSQSASKGFEQEYPNFDVVIIDEVSKATPPELLLPILKGKKIILVGDHHQLPPLIGNESLQEVAEKIPDDDRRKEITEYLKESLFERLFKTMPLTNKQTLRIQYRMHEDIMDTISQFYLDKEAPGGRGLNCGLKDSNLERDHLVEGHYVKRGQHLMWFDIPNEEKYFEKREEGMKSLVNVPELKLILELLQDINYGIENAKKNGLMPMDKRKSIGVISFYAEQVKKLKIKVKEHEENLNHLNLRIGTVDRFQGMESDVIITSFVRNNGNEGIGFARDYRRLNVALSRAKELLIITGSTKMFTERNRDGQSRKMYNRVIEVTQEKNGLRDHFGRYK